MAKTILQGTIEGAGRRIDGKTNIKDSTTLSFANSQRADKKEGNNLKVISGAPVTDPVKGPN